MKRIYRGFKTECPSGLITEEGFHAMYSRFFPQRGERGKGNDMPFANVLMREKFG
jgi:hypothetical protein